MVCSEKKNMGQQGQDFILFVYSCVFKKKKKITVCL